MADLAENDDLSAGRHQTGVRFADFLLEAEHHGAGAVDQAQAQAAHPVIDLGRLAVRPDQQGFARYGPVHLQEIAPLDGHEPARFQAGEFFFVVDDGAERIQPAALGEGLLRRADGADHTAAKS